MPQRLGPDSIGTVTRNSGTQVQLAASKITIGGQQYTNSVALLLNTGGTGAGGLDTGTLGNFQIWYIHAVVSGGVSALVASLSKTAPTGFTTFTWTGWVFVTNNSATIGITANSTRWDTQSFTPGWLGSGSNPSLGNGTISGRWGRDGDHLVCRISITFGNTTTAGTGEWGFGGPSFQIDTAKLANLNGSDGDSIVGEARQYNSTYYHGDVTGTRGQNNFGNGYVSVARGGDNTAASFWGATSPAAASATMVVTLDFRVPIVGWSANTL